MANDLALFDVPGHPSNTNVAQERPITMASITLTQMIGLGSYSEDE